MASYEMQGLTWQALKKNQQDAVLIAGKVIQHKGIYSKPFLFNADESWCAAVADGISSHRHSGMAAHQVLETVQRYYAQHEQDIKFSYIQDELCRALDHADLNDLEDAEGSLSCAETYGAGTTMALARHAAADPPDLIRIQSLGDSRVYAFCSLQWKWQPLTLDDNFYNELAGLHALEDQELASIYDVLTGFFCADWQEEVAEKNTVRYQVKTGDALLICTDGVYDAMEHAEWPPVALGQPLKVWLTEFYESIKCRAGDNLSLVLIRVNS